MTFRIKTPSWRNDSGILVQELADLMVERHKLFVQFGKAKRRLELSRRPIAQARPGQRGKTPFFGAKRTLRTEDPNEDRDLDTQAEEILMASREPWSGDDDWLSEEQVAHRQAKEVYCLPGYPEPLLWEGIYGRAYNPTPPHCVERFSKHIDPWDQDQYESNDIFRTTSKGWGYK